MNFKPMLASTAEKSLKFPLLASPKLDGIRAIVIDGVVVSRTLKPIPNAYVQELFGKPELNGLDGELIVGEPNSQTAFRDTTSGVMAKAGKPDVKFWVFDDASCPEKPFSERLLNAKSKVEITSAENLSIVPHVLIADSIELESYEAEQLGMGFEGVMLRVPSGSYKFGRSALLVKLKRFDDAEAIVLGFDELMSNNNEAVVDNLGYTQRSTSKSGLLAAGTLGSLVVQAINGHFENAKFSIGAGIDDKTRQEIWDNRDSYRSQVVKFKYFSGGSKDAPRFPVFLGFRKDI